MRSLQPVTCNSAGSQYSSIVWRKGERGIGWKNVKMSEAEVEHGLDLYGALQKKKKIDEEVIKGQGGQHRRDEGEK